MGRYIDAKTFGEFCTNQNKLIEILNHRTDTLERHIIAIRTDMSWTKKILWAILGVGLAAFATTAVKALIGL